MAEMARLSDARVAAHRAGEAFNGIDWVYQNTVPRVQEQANTLRTLAEQYEAATRERDAIRDALVEQGKDVTDIGEDAAYKAATSKLKNVSELINDALRAAPPAGGTQ